jgi:hypothetical protein
MRSQNGNAVGAASAWAGRRQDNEIEIKGVQLELDVVWISEGHERPAVLVLDLRVRDAKRIEVSRPLFERRSIADVERQVIEADRTLVETCGRRTLCLSRPRRFVPVGVIGRRTSYSPRPSSFHTSVSRAPLK